ncbi:MAG: DUF421 domain-containing protein [Herpetosiphonaceae bacterium]|nr:MAG: DUF421 domain-containing protein [Herpetosiphonaceae bacterium]
MFLVDRWGDVLRIIIVGVPAYAGLVLFLRISGKRTLTKMNAFDFVVTVALGSTLATILLSGDVALLEGLVALALLISLQYAISWLSLHSQNVRSLIKAQPALIFFRGEFLKDVMRRERLTEGEIRAAVREHGYAALEDILAVVLETDGSITVVPSMNAESSSALSNVRYYPPDKAWKRAQ